MDNLLKTINSDNGNVAIILSTDRGFSVKAKTKSDKDFSVLDFYYDFNSANKAAETLVKELH